MRHPPVLTAGLIAWALALPAWGQVTFTDNFNAPLNYLTNGVTGTIWDGVYFGAGEFANTGLGGGGPGATIQCDSAITAAGRLTLQTTGTAWENADDDGFFLFKVIKGDFSVSVHVVSPFNNAGYNTAGLQARAFSAGGAPFGGAENFVSWTRFDEYGYANYLRSEVNGGVAQINPGDSPNSNYWLRMDRVNGTNFMFYQRATSSGAWQAVSFPAPVNGTVLRRADLAGQSLQVGIIHATFAGQLGVQFSNFSLTASNLNAAATPAPAAGLILATNGANLDASWAPGPGSAGSLVVVWTGTNQLVKEMPASGFAYTANANYGAGSTLPGDGYYVVYAGPGTNVSVGNLLPGTTYNVAVFSYAGAGSSSSYSRRPATGSLTVPLNPLWAQVNVQTSDVVVTSRANPGRWYWLQYSDSLNPAAWRNAIPAPVYANGSSLTLRHTGGATAPQRYYRLLQMDPSFALKLVPGGIASLRRTGDVFPTEYLGGQKLGDAVLSYRQTGLTWLTARTANLGGISAVTYSTNADGTRFTARYQLQNGLSGPLIFESVFTLQPDALLWTLNLTNQSGQAVTVGDLALPLPMNASFSGVTSSVFRHALISGHGSFLYWMRPNSVGPYLLMTPMDNTRLEYWDYILNGYEVYIHSAAAGAIAAGQGTRWRQPNTSLTLPAGGSTSYGFKLQWADDYDGVRQALVDAGKLDVRIVPGMTVPTNLSVQIALRTTQQVAAVTAEFPASTQIQYLGPNGPYQLYQAQFSTLGENELTIQYGAGQSMFLEFFVTEPIEILLKKRAAFLVGTQINDATKWYNSLFAEWNLNDQVLVTPDNYDTLSGFVVYEVASDDAGESRPAYLATKEALYPVQSEVAALDAYIRNFVWGGLQRTTNESYAYGIYGIPDWHQNRTNHVLSLGRGYDYPHIVVMYYGMYQVARYHPEVTTELSAQEYLRRAYGTAVALFTVAGGAQAYQIGLMNEVITPDLLDALEAEGMTSEAATLRGYWEQKVNYFVTGNPNLFGSEYAFDSTGFESTAAFARYAVEHAGSSAWMGSTNPAAFLQQAWQFMSNQVTANVFDRGWLETAYYYYGSDYRGGGGNDYVLSYMSQMGGSGILDYALNFATKPEDYLRLGYGSLLSAWATMNTGTPASNYGFWYPGAANDGGCGGGFEPSPYNTTWLGQPMHRGNWYYSCEENLGFCGALRSAATILADDPIFGRFCYGGTWQQTTNLQVACLDGVRRRFHALLATGKLHLAVDTDLFTASAPLALEPDLSRVSFTLETDNPASHTARMHLSVSAAGSYTVSNGSGTVATLNLQPGIEAVVDLPIPANTVAATFTISR